MFCRSAGTPTTRRTTTSCTTCSTASLDGNNYGYSNDEFDALVDEAKQTTDPDLRADLFNQAEEILLNTDVNAVPINWYVGDYAYDEEKISDFPQTRLGSRAWEQVASL